MCSAAMENCFVVGTLSWKLLVYDFRMRKLQWSKDLSDTPLCLCATSGYWFMIYSYSVKYMVIICFNETITYDYVTFTLCI